MQKFKFDSFKLPKEKGEDYLDPNFDTEEAK